MSYYLGIDLGTSSVKVVVIEESGRTVGKGSEGLSLSTPRSTWAEQDPQEWWKATKTAIKKALANSGGVGKEVEGIGLTGQMLGATFLDKELEVIRPCIIWSDQRSSKERDYIKDSVGMEQLLKLTANYPLPGYVAPKLLWVRKNEPQFYRRIHKVLLPKDYLRLKLTGEIATEVSDAGGTYLFDVGKRDWSQEMLEELDIPRDFLPEVYESPIVTGKIRKEVAEELGLQKGVPVIGGGGDQPASGVGNGIVKEGIVSSTIGTSGVVFACTDSPKIDKKERGVHSFCHSVPGKWSVFGCTLAAGGSFQWLKNNLAGPEQNFAEMRGLDSYDMLTAVAEEAERGAEGLIFLPYLVGERTPHSDPNARGVFFGLTQQHGWAEMVRSVLEGITFSLRDSLEILREFGVEVKQVRASGGGARSRLWQQLQADIFNTEVVTTNVEEGSAMGAAIMAAVGAGAYPAVDKAAEEIVEIVNRTEPIKENVAYYEDIYKLYRSLYPALEDTFKKEAEILNKWE